MSDTGQIPGEGLPENAGTVEQPGVAAPDDYAGLAPSEYVPEDDDLLLMPSPQGAWSDPQTVPAPGQYPDGATAHAAVPAQGGHATQAVHAQGADESSAPPQGHVRVQEPAQAQQPAQAAVSAPAPAQVPDAYAGQQTMTEPLPGAGQEAQTEGAGGHHSGSADLGGARIPAPTPPPGTTPGPQPRAASRRPLHRGPVTADGPSYGGTPTGGVVRSLADRGPAGAPQPQAQPAAAAPQTGLPTGGPEYLQASGDASVLPGPQLGQILPQGAGPWSAPAPQTPPQAAAPVAAEAVAPETPAAEPVPAEPVPAEPVPAEPVVPEAVAPEAAPSEAPVTQAPAPEAVVAETGAPEAVVPQAAVEPAEEPAVEPVAEPAVEPAVEPAPAAQPVPATPEQAVVPEAASAPEPANVPVAEAAQDPAGAPTDAPAEQPVDAVAAPVAEGLPAEAGTGAVAPTEAEAPSNPAPEAVVESPEPVVEAAEPVEVVEAVAAPELAEPTPSAEEVPGAAPVEGPVPTQPAPAPVAQEAVAAEPEDAAVAAEPGAAEIVEPATTADGAAPQAHRPTQAPEVPPPVQAPAPEPAHAPQAVENVAPAEDASEQAPAPAAVPGAEAVAETPSAAAPRSEAVPQAPEAAPKAPQAVAAPDVTPPVETAPAGAVPTAGPQPDPESHAAPQAVPQPPAQEAEPPQAPASDGTGAPATPPAPGYDDAEREAVLRVMRERRDVRNGFRSDPIPHEVLLRVLEAAHTAPSVGHSQPWDFVVIRSAETRRSMHELAQRQRDAYAKSLPKGRAKQFKELKIEAILDTPVNIVVTADPTRGGRHTLGRHTQPQMAPYSSALAVENLWLAARAEGLGVGWVSFFDEREMVRALGLPEHLEVVAYLCVGYVDEFPEEPELMQAGWSKRRPLSWVVHEETYGRRALPGEEPHDLLQETISNIRPLDAKALGEAWERQKRMTKPAGALGMLEIISAQLSGLSRVCPPPIPEPAAVAIFAGDHGVHAQGVTAWPQEVTGQMVANFLGGGAVCNAFAAQVGAEVCVVDVGVATDLPATPGLLPRKVRAGTADFTTGPALTREEVLAAVEVGIETARDLVAAGNKGLLIGEMGIANTTASAALICVYTGLDPAEVTGRGTGINDEMHARKVDVVRRALELHEPDPADPIGVLAAVGGLEHAAMAGFLLGGASLRTPVVLDGVSAGAAALVARAIAPEALAACIAGHRSAEPGHVAALNKLGLRPLVDLDLRLGEGTGALLALPIVQSAARVMHEVATFDAAGVTEK
ncbi:nicotinate-nucleotide--dimethylbenzimidazole phosphoribosyltransferase [Streptomyces sp. NPDC047985]|uniref:nicotinate-nucleotide--dimethylbenzimidazole phosphoribosyltransferase n=1 Tax=Streptomyces sp. NPDC047985 TaxID=3155384 RepID=UPI00343C272C